MNDVNSVFTSLVLGLLVLVVYFLPAIVAAGRNHPSTGAVFALDLLLGWTFVGWVAALVWSLAGEERAQPPLEKKCPSCAEMVKAEATKCRFCGHEFAAAPATASAG